MKLLILSLILIISQVNCDEQIKEKIVEYKKLLCENPLTDKQVVDIKNNCMANRHPKNLEILKKCSNKSTLSDRDIVTSHCDPQITSCIREARKAAAGSEEPKEPKKKGNLEILTQLLECVKTALK